jgi:hypothetical protein
MLPMIFCDHPATLTTLVVEKTLKDSAVPFLFHSGMFLVPALHSSVSSLYDFVLFAQFVSIKLDQMISLMLDAGYFQPGFYAMNAISNVSLAFLVMTCLTLVPSRAVLNNEFQPSIKKLSLSAVQMAIAWG